jgi:hypothetical protein
MEIRNKLALIFRVFMEMLNEAHDFIIKSREFNLRPYSLFNRCVGLDLLGKIEQRLAWKEIDVIRLAPVSVEELAHVRDVTH